MKIRSKFFALLLTFAVGIGYMFAQGADIKAAYLKDGDIFTIGANGQSRRLTYDGIPKDFPLWSKDGTKIAFLRKTDRGTASGNLVVIDPETGLTEANILIRPVSPKEGNNIRYIEKIEWLTADKIAAAGSINPSTEDTIVLDARTGEEFTDYTDDAGGAVFSPDGGHAAAETGSPHWTPTVGAEPELDIDFQRVYPAKGVNVTLLSKPAWSEDSGKIAVVVEDYQSKLRSIALCGVQGGCESTALPASESDPNDRFQIQWNGGRVYVTSQQGTWSFLRGDSLAVVSLPLPSLKVIADSMTLGLQKQIQKLGGKQPDFRCADCALAKLPRQAPK
jgi:hypothetical protein